MPAKNGGKCGYVDDFCDDENCPYPIIKENPTSIIFVKCLNFFTYNIKCATCITLAQVLRFSDLGLYIG